MVGASRTGVGPGQLLLEACDHIERECLSALPDIEQFLDLLLLVFWRRLNEIVHQSGQHIGYLLHSRGKRAGCSVPRNRLACFLGPLQPLAGNRVHYV